MGLLGPSGFKIQILARLLDRWPSLNVQRRSMAVVVETEDDTIDGEDSNSDELEFHHFSGNTGGVDERGVLTDPEGLFLLTVVFLLLFPK